MVVGGGVEIYGREIERMGVGGGEVLKEVRAQRRKRDRQTDKLTEREKQKDIQKQRDRNGRI